MCDTSKCGTIVPDGDAGSEGALLLSSMESLLRFEIPNRSRLSKKAAMWLRKAREFGRARQRRYRAREVLCLLGTLPKLKETFVAYRLNPNLDGLPCRWPQCQAEWPNLCRPEGKASWIGLSLTLRSWTLSVQRWLVRRSPAVMERFEREYQDCAEERQDLKSSMRRSSWQRPLASALSDPFGVWERRKTLPPHLQPLDVSELPEDNQKAIQLQHSWEALSNKSESEVAICLAAEPAMLQELPSEERNPEVDLA